MSERVNSVIKGFCILVADRNPHVRSFLQRELSIVGFRVLTAKDGRETLRLIDSGGVPDLLILDLDIPHVNGLEILRKLQEQRLRLPVVVHTSLTQYAIHPTVRNTEAFIEKTGNHVDGLKSVIEDILRKWYPKRYNRQKVERQNHEKRGEGYASKKLDDLGCDHCA